MSSEIGKIAYTFLHVRDQIKIYHWQTDVYARHKASDSLVDKLTQNMDRFIEIIQGVRNVRLAMPRDTNFILKNQNDTGIITLLKSFADWLVSQEGLPKYLDKNKDTDLLNIRDEILGDVNQTLYLFTFH